MINRICSAALERGAAAQALDIDAALVTAAALENGIECTSHTATPMEASPEIGRAHV